MKRNIVVKYDYPSESTVLYIGPNRLSFATIIDAKGKLVDSSDLIVLNDTQGLILLPGEVYKPDRSDLKYIQLLIEEHYEF